MKPHPEKGDFQHLQIRIMFQKWIVWSDLWGQHSYIYDVQIEKYKHNFRPTAC